LREAAVTKFLLVTDLDHTLVGDDRALATLNQQITERRQADGTLLVYATGRSPILYQELKDEKHLLDPDALIAAVGTEIYRKGSSTPDSAWSEQLSQGWDRDEIVAATAHFADLTPQPDTEQRPFKVSFFLTEEAAEEVLPQLEALLKQRELDCKFIYSSGIDLDILPRKADKGAAVTFLREAWGIAPDRTVVCGDSGNDIALFQGGQERGIIVGNARPELLQWHLENPNPNRYLAKAHCAAGILEGLEHFSFVERV
jgi:sucrose-6-phosphatase